jgi:hypothetical protein
MIDTFKTIDHTQYRWQFKHNMWYFHYYIFIDRCQRRQFSILLIPYINKQNCSTGPTMWDNASHTLNAHYLNEVIELTYK